MGRLLIGNIKGPQGAQGIQGPQGPVGATGPQGPMPDLINNALTTEAGVAALDAAMGKTLQDQITQLNGDIYDNVYITPTDINNAEILDGGYCKVGKIVLVSMRVKTTGEYISIKIPKPYLTLNAIGGAIYNTTQNKVEYFYVNTPDGRLSFNSISIGDEFLISFSYMSA